jgi:transposase-like protein
VSPGAMSEIAEDLKAIFKVRREETAKALVEEFVELYEKRYPKAISVSEAGILRYSGSHHADTHYERAGEIVL